MAQRYSQNGWKAETTARNFTRFQACGEGWWAANDDVAVVFTEFIERFNAEVEPVYQKLLDDWSYANRLIRGSSTVVSNHGSGTAIDINATKHPLGTRTFSAKKLKSMRKIKDGITDDAGRPVLRLGADYTGRPDEMHVEINANPAHVKQAANKIRKKREAPTMDLRTKVTLTDAGARNMTVPGYTPRESGQKLSLEYLVLWGGPGMYRILGKVDQLHAENAALAAQIGALSQAIAALATGSAADVAEAFAQGIADMEAAAASVLQNAVAELDLKLVVDDIADEPAQ